MKGGHLPQFLKSLFLIVTALLPIVNPLGNAPIFLALTGDSPPGARLGLAWRIARYSLFLLLGSLIVGTYVLDFFGVSLPIVQIGGGLIVLSAGWTMLKHEDDQRQEIRRGVAPQDAMQKAFYPLTLPLTVGPGSISVAITLGANAPHAGGSRLILALTAALIGSLIVALTVFLSYAFADRLAALLGPTAMNVIVRLSSFLLTCVGLQIMWNGLSTLLHMV